LAGRRLPRVERVERETEERTEHTERIIVRQPTTTSPSPKATSAPTPDGSDDDLTDVVPKVPLPEPVGKTTDDVKDVVDDTVKKLPLP